MKHNIETTYFLSRVIIACIMIALPFASCQLAGWLILDFCLALFFIMRIKNKNVLTFIIVLQIIVSLIIFVVLNTFIARGPFDTLFSIIKPNSQYYYCFI
jgi:hypothetical protein